MNGQGDHLSPAGTGPSDAESPNDSFANVAAPLTERASVLPTLVLFPTPHALFGSTEDILYLSADRIIWGRKPIDRIIPEAAAEGDHFSLFACLGKTGREISLSRVTKVELWEEGTYGKISTLNFRRGHLLRVTTQTETLAWLVPKDVAEILAQAFPLACPERFFRMSGFLPVRIPPSEALQLFWIYQIPFLLVVVANAKVGTFASVNFTDASQVNRIAGLFLLFSSVVEFQIILFLSMHLFRSLSSKYLESNPKRVRRDRSRTRPLSMPLTGCILKYGGALIFLTYFLRMQFFPAINPGANTGAISTAFIYFVLVLLVFTGYRLSLIPAEKHLSTDKRLPILYLRSFRDDGGNSFNPTGVISNLLGLKVSGFLTNSNPVRVIRMIVNRPADTAEEQLASFLSRFGPFIAVGKPGEWVPLGGASRIYVPDDEWRDKVLDFINRSQFVVLQPAETSGVWWEVEQMLERVAPARVLLSLVNFAGKPNRYTLFRWRFEKITGRKLPRVLSGAVFCKFRKEWEPEMLPSYLHSPFLWPVIGCGFNFKKTLRPFFDGLRGVDPSPPGKSTPILIHRVVGFLAILFWFTMTLGISGLSIYAGKEWRANRILKDNQAGINALDHQDYAVAVTYFSRVIDSDPSNAVAYFNRGFARGMRKEHGLAVADFSASIRLNPKYAPAYDSRGELYMGDGDLAKAISDFDQALSMDPKNPTALFDRGSAYHAQGHDEKALADLNSVICLDPNAWPAYVESSTIFATSSRSDLRDGTKAVKYALQAGSLQKWQNPALLAVLAAAYAEAGDFNDAVKYENQCLRSTDLGAAARAEFEDRLVLYRAHTPFRLP